MRRVSLNQRLAQDAQASDEVEVVLIKITHEDLDDPVRLSTDPTELISVEPLAYGTRSTWLNDNPETEPYLFILVNTLLPGDQDEAPHSAQLILEAVDNQMAEVLRSTTNRARVDIAVVLASSPNEVEAEWQNLLLVASEGDAGEIRLDISAEPLTAEPWPAGRMSKERFPGLFK